MKLEGLKRIDVPEINKGALREAIINAFCHRDYSINQEVQIALFKDGVEILNPGKLIGSLKIKDILSKPVSIRRNELIADIFHRIKYIEKWGTGIGKILKLEPETTFEEIGDFFLVKFKRKNLTVEKTVEKILIAIQQKPSITIKELENITGLSRRGIEWNIKKLKKEGKIKRIGPDKGGYWEIVK
jgi:ATP-dependent DNA helicase RecG